MDGEDRPMDAEVRLTGAKDRRCGVKNHQVGAKNRPCGAKNRRVGGKDLRGDAKSHRCGERDVYRFGMALRIFLIVDSSAVRVPDFGRRGTSVAQLMSLTKTV
jgi:hypothetical protein